MFLDKKIAVIIPALDEAETIAEVIHALPDFVDQVVVADNASQDNTALCAANAGAQVVMAQKRGYGSACLAGIHFLQKTPPDIVVFLDGDGSDDPCQLDKVLTPVANNTFDLCLASRTILPSEHGALSMSQRLGNYLICGLIAVFWSKKFSDLGPFRAITWKALRSLTMKDSNLGWTLEMQIKAVKKGLTTIEVPVEYKCRQGGQSKVSGNLQTSISAGAKMFFIIGQQLLTR